MCACHLQAQGEGQAAADDGERAGGGRVRGHGLRGGVEVVLRVGDAHCDRHAPRCIACARAAGVLRLLSQGDGAHKPGVPHRWTPLAKRHLAAKTIVQREGKAPSPGWSRLC